MGNPPFIMTPFIPYRRIIFPIIGIIISVALYYNGIRLYYSIHNGFAWDFAINWTAAHGVRSGLSVYDSGALQGLGKSLIGSQMPNIFTAFFNSYIGPPSTVFIYFPFTLFSFPNALILYRFTIIIAFIMAIIIAGLILPRDERKHGWSIGAVLFITLYSVNISIFLGQVDGFVILALAAGLWAASRERMYLAGICFGIAALLKISPALLVFYFLLRGTWKILGGALVACGTILLCATLIGEPCDLPYFIENILPSLSYCQINAENQSLPAFLGRGLLPVLNKIGFSIPIDTLRLLPPLIALGGILCVYLQRRHQPFHVADGGLLIIAGLLAGPITWVHYTSWAIISCVSVLDSRLWRNVHGRQVWIVSGLLLLGWILQIPPILYMEPRTVAMLFRTGLTTTGLLLWFVAIASILSLNSPRTVDTPKG